MYMYTEMHFLHHDICLLNQPHSLLSNILQLNLLRRGNRLQYADRGSLEMPIFYKNKAIHRHVSLFI